LGERWYSDAAEAPDPRRVREALAAAIGSDPGELRLSRIPGGASREVWLAEGSDGRWALRRDPPGAQSFVPLEVEHRVVSAAAEAGVPVPHPLGFEPEGGRFGTAGFVMEHVGGQSVAPRVLRRDELAGARDRLVSQLAEALAAIHALDASALDDIPAPEGDPALAACDFWEAQLDEIGEPLPATEAGLRWLRLNAPPPPSRAVLVHGDYRLGNFIVSEKGLAAVIDWELCHVGDPAEDLGWLCVRSWRFGNDDRPAAGLGSVDELLGAYERAGGTPPDADRLRWWEAMGNAKWAVICARQAADHLSGRRRSAELASLGRRTCEPEWDLLELIRAGGRIASDE
jgi:aminoglycoside phosphotransferase (APT) family kinase protein